MIMFTVLMVLGRQKFFLFRAQSYEKKMEERGNKFIFFSSRQLFSAFSILLFFFLLIFATYN